MSTTMTTRCDQKGCTALRGQDNNWWVIRKGLADLTIMKHGHGHRQVDGDLDMCGRQCVIAAVVEFLESGKTGQQPLSSP